MKIVSAADEETMSVAAAEIVADAIRERPASVIMLAVGRSPLRLYSILAERIGHDRLSAKDLTAIQLDEYWGLERSDERHLHRWLDRSVLTPWGVADEHVVRFDMDLEDPAAVCADYDQRVKAAHGIDLAILGIGPNGHLGFNEPPSAATSPTRLVKLTPESIKSNGSYWGGEQNSPREALTAGMSLILGARAIVLVASGPHKRRILQRALTESPSPDLPASYLQRHDSLTVVADQEALAGWDRSDNIHSAITTR